MKRYLIIVMLLCLFGSLHADFYRTKNNRYIADVAFAGNQIVVLENRYNSSILCLLDLEGNKLSETEFQQMYEELYIDCFGDCLLLNQDSCLQVIFDRQLKATPLATFSRKQFQDKISRIIFEFNDAYLIRDMVYDKHDYHVKAYHGQAQSYSYMLKNDPNKERHLLWRFVDTEAVKICQSSLNQIIATYNYVVPPGANELQSGTWDGDLLRLDKTTSTHIQIRWYQQYVAKGYNTTALKFKDFIQLIDLRRFEIVEIDKDFKVSGTQPLKILSREQYFKNKFLTDEATGKTYGLFVKDGMVYLGLYNPKTGAVGVSHKASDGIYPRGFKVHGGYAYSVFFDKGKNQGVLTRVKINE